MCYNEVIKERRIEVRAMSIKKKRAKCRNQHCHQCTNGKRLDTTVKEGKKDIMYGLFNIAVYSASIGLLVQGAITLLG